MADTSSSTPFPGFPASGRPYVIAGPCSAETPGQVMETARALKKNPAVHAFRAGIWKPRTRPNAFEGHGTSALGWLTAVREETGLPVATEVANAAHTEEALKAGIDILWIGARTTVNPFSVQEIAEVLKGCTGQPVLVKNPVTPDLGLWIGAVERLQNAGLDRLAAVHRGFSGYARSEFRNAPEWSLPIDFRRQMPAIPLLCDPSHIAGNRHLLQQVAQTALDLDYAGLMIETHPQPDEAWSDPQQQITPAELTRLLNGLRYSRPGNGSSAGQHDRLAELRKEIDKIDLRILEMVAERMQVVRQIGEYKKEKGMTVLQIRRWTEIFENRTRIGKTLGLSGDTVRQLFEWVHLRSIALQEKILRGEDPGDQPPSAA